jgi:hypothetical protein
MMEREETRDVVLERKEASWGTGAVGGNGVGDGGIDDADDCRVCLDA